MPKLFPFKEKVLKEIQQSKENLAKEKEQRILAARQGKDDGLNMEVEESGMARLAQHAEERGAEFEEEATMIVDAMEVEYEESAKKDISRKAYNKEFKKVIEQADVILYILDARDPDSTRSKEIEQMIRESPNGEKQLILILNKIGISFLTKNLTKILSHQKS